MEAFEISIPGFTTVSLHHPQAFRLWSATRKVRRGSRMTFRGWFAWQKTMLQWIWGNLSSKHSSNSINPPILFTSFLYLFILYKPRVVTLWQDLRLSQLTSNDNDVQHKLQPWTLVGGICTRQSCLSSFSSCAGVQPLVQTGEWWFGEFYSVQLDNLKLPFAITCIWLLCFCSCGQGSLCAGRILRCLQQFRISGAVVKEAESTMLNALRDL